jgi:hypothetical protein
MLSTFAYGASANPGLNGSYQCVECHGLLDVKGVSSERYSVRLTVGSGSCGGQLVAKGMARLSETNTLSLPYNLERKRCVLKISFIKGGAVVADSCTTPEMEANSTCATLGEYNKQ